MSLQAGWLILKSFPEHVDVLALMNAIADVYGALPFSVTQDASPLCAGA